MFGRLTRMYNIVSGATASLANGIATAASYSAKATLGATTVAAIGTAAGRFNQGLAIRASGALEGVARGAAGMFGENAANWAGENTKWLAGKISGVDYNKLSKEDRATLESWRDGGEVVGFVGTLAIPGGAVARGVGLGIRGGAAALKLANGERVITAAGRLTHAIAEAPGIGKIARGTSNLLGKSGMNTISGQLAHGMIDYHVGDAVFSRLPIKVGSVAHAATPNASSADITTGSNALITSTQNVTATFSKAAEDGVVSNADIAALKENATALKGAKLSDADRAAFAKEAATIIRGFETKPADWTDARTYRLQILLKGMGYEGSEADSIFGKDTNDMIKQFKHDNKTLFTQPAPVMAPH